MYPFYEYLVHCQIGYAIPYKQEPARLTLISILEHSRVRAMQLLAPLGCGTPTIANRQ